VKDPNNPQGGVWACGSTSLTMLDQVQRGEPGGWQRLVSSYTPLVVAWCRRHDVSGTEADDIKQEVFATVWKRIQDFRKQPGPSFRGWLRAIARNKLGDRLRQRSREPARGVGGTDAQDAIARIAAPVCAGETAPEAIEDEDSRRRLLCRRALVLICSQFEPRTFHAFWRIVVQDRSAAEVAAELSLSPNAVYIAKSRVLRRLREVLAELDAAQFEPDHSV